MNHCNCTEISGKINECFVNIAYHFHSAIEDLVFKCPYVSFNCK